MAKERKGHLLTVEIDRTLFASVVARSKQTGVSIAFKVREALELWIDDKYIGDPIEAGTSGLNAMAHSTKSWYDEERVIVPIDET